MIDKKTKLEEKRDLGKGNYLLTFSSPEQAQLVRPGQFVMLRCAPGFDEIPLLRRPLSVFDIWRDAQTERPTGLQLLVKDIGFGTHKLVTAPLGSEVYMLGPQGRCFQISAEIKNQARIACLVAGGVGIAALYLLARALMAEGLQPVLFYGARTAEDLVLRDYFERLELETHYATEDGTLGERGLVTALVEPFLSQRVRIGLRIYACGPWAMMKATHLLATRHHVGCEVSLEARMGCSLGACMGCVTETWNEAGQKQYLRVCREGPVMNSDAVNWDATPF